MTYWALQHCIKHVDGAPFSIYSLRHAYASTMLLLGVPDKYAMERMGHATNNMLKTVYQHTFDNQQKDISQKIDAYFKQLEKK